MSELFIVFKNNVFNVVLNKDFVFFFKWIFFSIVVVIICNFNFVFVWFGMKLIFIINM